MVGEGTVADVGCGPGHVTRFVAASHPDVLGIDISPGMIAEAHERHPHLRFLVGSMLHLPARTGTWAGAIAMYSIIHFLPRERADACRELARVVRPGGWLLVAFHTASAEFPTGAVNHLTSWFGHAVDLDGYFLDPSVVSADLVSAGFTVTARMDRSPSPETEYPSRRCYLLARR